jgi:Predicted hydrolases or acyltransferases (alpha/beta hydrolase superfamily)
MKNLALVIVMLVSFFANQFMAQTQRTPASAGRAEYIEVEKGVKLHVTDLGEGQPIVLIHGWPLSDEMYEYQYQYLSRKGFRVIGITLRGFGKSDKPYGKYDFDVFSDDIKVVLDKLKIENALMGGFSMGGTVVLHYVTKYNSAHVGKLALFGAAAPSWSKRYGFPNGVPADAAENLIKATMTDRQNLVAGLGAAFQAKEGNISKNMERWIERISLDASPYATTESIKSLRDLDLRPQLSKINIPVAIFHGVQDKSCPFVWAEDLQKGIKNSKLIRFENSGHALFLEEVDKFNTELEKFAKS